MILYVCVSTCRVVRSSCRCCEFYGPTLRGESASELAPGSHTHPGANERNYAPSLGPHQEAQCRQTHPSCRKTSRERLAHILNYYPTRLSSHQLAADDGTHRNINTYTVPTPSSFPPALCSSTKLQALRVNPTGQCCPTERQTCWPGKHCPLVGLVLTGLQSVSRSQLE